MKYSNKWEEISNQCFRLKVPGGWLVRDWDGGEDFVATALCFLADPSYSWEIVEEKDGHA